MKVETTFLGSSSLVKAVAGCSVALTSYAGNREFEEWHAHEQPSISFLLSGTHQEELFGKTHQRIPGDIKYIPAGEMHRCENYAHNAKKINLDLAPSALKNMNVTEQQITALLAAAPASRFTLLKLYHELNDTASHATASAQLLLYELFNTIGLQQAIADRNHPLWVNRLRELLHDDWQAKFDLDELAGIAGVHPVTLSRYFPKYFSATLGQYMRQLKVQKSLELIRNSSLSLTTIAYTCGFADQAHFTRTFRDMTGYLPGAFRKI